MTDYKQREIVLVTPELARQWLRTRVDYQRSISRNDVLAYAKAMKEGKWDENVPQAICFDTEGKLCDGQHRLEAVVTSGVSVRFEIERGMTKKTFNSLDQGRRRSAHDFIDAKNAKNTASTINRILGLKTGRYSFSALCMRTPSRKEILREDVVSEFERIPGYYISLVETAQKIYRFIRIAPPSLIAYAIWSEQLLENDQFMEDFIFELCNLTTTEVTVQLLRQTIANKRSENGSSHQTDKWAIGVFLKSYELYKQGKFQKRLNNSAQFLDMYDKRIREVLGGTDEKEKTSASDH